MILRAVCGVHRSVYLQLYCMECEEEIEDIMLQNEENVEIEPPVACDVPSVTPSGGARSYQTVHVEY